MAVKKFFPLLFILYSVVACIVLVQGGKLTLILTHWAFCLVAAFIFMSFVFFIGSKLKRYDVIDAAWGLVFIVIALTNYLLVFDEVISVSSLVLLLIAVWGLRLSWHIAARIRVTDHEDPRYVALRKNWTGNVVTNMFFRVYMVQALLALVISIPVIYIQLFSDTSWGLWAVIGVIVWLVGFVFEVVGDRQLRQFIVKPQNKGKIMQNGLWKYSRHPNYFGEITQWWGIFIIATGIPFGWVTVIGPVVITILILFVSGIPLNEARFEGRLGWKGYKERTSVLLPLPPRS